nr:MAG TPA: hypothetical protein [Caudoviricetes sp.]
MNLKINFQNNSQVNLQFKIKSSCSCGNLTYKKRCIYKGFRR